VEVKVRFTQPMNPDSDGDGLSDFQEVGLGTDPNNADTDGLADLEEIEGFTDPHGVKWHTDPLQPDTNKDGIADLIERGATPGVARDTDNDGAPDLYDMDNDGDGVPDNVDLSPFTAITTVYGLTSKAPFSLTLNGIEPGRTAFLDLQLRPQDEEHLRYVYNVLDWPIDRKGQVQDWDNQTFAQNLVVSNYDFFAK
jgi:large repetitive protein